MSTFHQSLPVKIGLAISTFTEEKTDTARYQIIERSLSSLSKVLPSVDRSIISDVYVVIVVDGPVPQKHRDLVAKYSFPIYFRPQNGGVSRTKNTSIRLLLEQKVHIGYLMDDDVEYKRGCLEKYSSAVMTGKIHHISFCQMHPLVHPPSEWKKMKYYQTNINGQQVMRHGGGGVGCLLSFTPELIKKMGYFKVMKGKYGFEHINFTHRAIHHKMIPFASDIVNSLQYLDHIGFEPVGYNKFNKKHSISEKYRKSENDKNKLEWKKDFNKYVPLIE